MDENSNNKKAYTVVDMSENEKKKSNHTFGKGIFLPFCSGVIGATLAIGTCFGIPQVRDTLLKSISSIETSTTSENNNTSTLTRNFFS